MRLRRALGVLGFLALLELAARAIVYGLAPSADEASRHLGGRLGGPGFLAVLLVGVGIAAGLSVAAVWLASLGVRERWALADERPLGPPPRVAVARLLTRALALTLAGWLTFAAVESVIHLREGLGFHGIECLVGPVHRNALPVVGALALLASALQAAAGLVLAWMRRTVARFARPRAHGRARPVTSLLLPPAAVRRAPLLLGAPPRGPPVVA